MPALHFDRRVVELCWRGLPSGGSPLRKGSLAESPVRRLQVGCAALQDTLLLGDAACTEALLTPLRSQLGTAPEAMVEAPSSLSPCLCPPLASEWLSPSLLRMSTAPRFGWLALPPSDVNRSSFQCCDCYFRQILSVLRLLGSSTLPLRTMLLSMDNAGVP